MDDIAVDFNWKRYWYSYTQYSLVFASFYIYSCHFI